jgi:hypothetical protein
MGLQRVLGQGAIAIAATAVIACAAQPRISIAPEGQAIVGITRVSFEATAPRSSGEPIYRWDFGDGEKGSGKVAEHIYRTEGTFRVTLTVESSSKSTTARARVKVRSLSGIWDARAHNTASGAPFSIDLTQADSALSGRITYSVCPHPYPDTVPDRQVEGTVSHPRTIRWTLVCGNQTQWTGEVSTDMDRIVLRPDGASAADPPRIYYRTGSGGPAAAAERR